MDKKKYSGIGGQAVMEGIMMKNENHYAIAVRKPNREIEVTVDECHPLIPGKAAKLPLIRGVVTFIESLVLGFRSLSWSASFFDEEEEKVKVPDSELSGFTELNTDKKQSKQKDKKGKKNEPAGEDEAGFLMTIAVIFSLVMSVGLFILVPYFVSILFKRFIQSEILIAVLEGVLRLVIFVGYVSAISMMKDIKRVYQYHGAEHKCINCIEHGHELTVENVMRSSRLHSRCGTSFMLFVMFISIILFFFIRTDNPLLRVLIRIALIPVISGISYEIIRLAGRSDNIFVNILSAPGMCLQRITTREPDESMVEVAIKAVEAVFDWRAYHNEVFGTGNTDDIQKSV